MEYKKHKYTKSVDSYWNPGTLVTWPQFLSEVIVLNRVRRIKEHAKIYKGEGWWRPVARQVTMLNQQCSHILSYFDNIEQNPNIKKCVLEVFKDPMLLSVGAVRKTPSSATKVEKQVVSAIKYRLKQLDSVRNVEYNIIETEYKPQKEGNKWTKFQNLT